MFLVISHQKPLVRVAPILVLVSLVTSLQGYLPDLLKGTFFSCAESVGTSSETARMYFSPQPFIIH